MPESRFAFQAVNVCDEHKKHHSDPDPCELDAHHITNRSFMPNGGYVKENGISVCPECHEKAEQAESQAALDLYKKSIQATRMPF